MILFRFMDLLGESVTFPHLLLSVHSRGCPWGSSGAPPPPGQDGDGDGDGDVHCYGDDGDVFVGWSVSHSVGRSVEGWEWLKPWSWLSWCPLGSSQRHWLRPGTASDLRGRTHYFQATHTLFFHALCTHNTISLQMFQKHHDYIF